MSETGPQTHVKIFGLQEYDIVHLDTRDIPKWETQIMAMARIKLPAPVPEPPAACLMMLRAYLFEDRGLTKEIGASERSGEIFAARLVAVFARLREAEFSHEHDNWILVEATTQSFALSLYRAEWWQHFESDLAKARSHFEQYRGLRAPPSKKPHRPA